MTRCDKTKAHTSLKREGRHIPGGNGKPKSKRRCLIKVKIQKSIKYNCFENKIHTL